MANTRSYKENRSNPALWPQPATLNTLSLAQLSHSQLRCNLHRFTARFNPPLRSLASASFQQSSTIAPTKSPFIAPACPPPESTFLEPAPWYLIDQILIGFGRVQSGLPCTNINTGATVKKRHGLQLNETLELSSYTRNNTTSAVGALLSLCRGRAVKTPQK